MLELGVGRWGRHSETDKGASWELLLAARKALIFALLGSYFLLELYYIASFYIGF